MGYDSRRGPCSSIEYQTVFSKARPTNSYVTLSLYESNIQDANEKISSMGLYSQTTLLTGSMSESLTDVLTYWMAN